MTSRPQAGAEVTPVTGPASALHRGGLLAQLGSTLMSDAVGIVTSLVFSILVTRALQPEGKGVYSVLTSGVTLAVTIASMGLGKSLVFFLNRSEAPRGEITGTVAALFPVMVGAGGLLLVAGLPNLRNAEGAAALALGVGLVATTLLVGVVEGCHRALRRIHVVNLASVGQSLAQVALVVALAATVGIDIETALSVGLVTMLVRLTIVAWPLRRVAELRPVFGGVTRHAATMLRYCAVYQLYVCAWSLLCRLDVVLVGHLQGAEVAGLYATSAGLAQHLWRVAVAINFVFLPYCAAMKHDRDSILLATMATRLVAPVLVGAALLGIALSDVVVELLYGASFAPSALPLRILLPGAAAGGLYQLLAQHFIARGRFGPLLVASGVGLALDALLNLALLPRLAEVGAAVAATASFTCAFLLLADWLRRHEGIAMRELVWPRREDLAALRGRTGG